MPCRERIYLMLSYQQPKPSFKQQLITACIAEIKLHVLKKKGEERDWSGPNSKIRQPRMELLCTADQVYFMLKKPYLLVCWSATPGKANCLLANCCSIQTLQCILSILSVIRDRRVDHCSYRNQNNLLLLSTITKTWNIIPGDDNNVNKKSVQHENSEKVTY
jgi:hypothetical protein